MIQLLNRKPEHLLHQPQAIPSHENGHASRRNMAHLQEQKRAVKRTSSDLPYQVETSSSTSPIRERGPQYPIYKT